MDDEDRNLRTMARVGMARTGAAGGSGGRGVRCLVPRLQLRTLGTLRRLRAADRRAVSLRRPVHHHDRGAYFLWHDFPEQSVFDGGELYAAALQLRVALTDRVAIIATKDGWVWNRNESPVLDQSQGFRGGAVLLVPLDLPGISRPRPLDKLGQRALNQGEIFFDEVRIPRGWMAVPPEGYEQAANMVLTNANTGMGTLFAGLARAALELAINYAKERKQGGVPIIEHQTVRWRLSEMFRKTEAARALNRAVSMSNSLNQPRLEFAIATKVTSTQTAFEVSSEALQIFGGNGTSREYQRQSPPR